MTDDVEKTGGDREEQREHKRYKGCRERKTRRGYKIFIMIKGHGSDVMTNS